MDAASLDDGFRVGDWLIEPRESRASTDGHAVDLTGEQVAVLVALAAVARSSDLQGQPAQSAARHQHLVLVGVGRVHRQAQLQFVHQHLERSLPLLRTLLTPLAVQGVKDGDVAMLLAEING